MTDLDLLSAIFNQFGYVVVGDYRTHPIGYSYLGLDGRPERIMDQPMVIVGTASREEVRAQYEFIKSLGVEDDRWEHYPIYYKVSTD